MTHSLHLIPNLIRMLYLILHIRKHTEIHKFPGSLNFDPCFHMNWKFFFLSRRFIIILLWFLFYNFFFFGEVCDLENSSWQICAKDYGSQKALQIQKQTITTTQWTEESAIYGHNASPLINPGEIYMFF